MKIQITVIIIMLFASCKVAKWPSQEYITKYHYQEVQGRTIESGKQKPERLAMYQNGLKGIHELIALNMQYPAGAKDNLISGTVILKYVVDQKGYVTDIRITQRVHPLLDAEARRIARLMKRWIPGYLNNQPVKIEYTQPFRFALD